MTELAPRPIDIAFSPAVKAAQEAHGSRQAYAGRDMEADITPDLQAFLEAQRSVFLATASAAGQPYVQHRGGAPGFLRVVGPRTLAFADYRGNKQYITVGNASENERAFLFTIDYRHRRRVKLWGRLEVREGKEEARELMPEGYRAVPERVILFHVEAWDVNCPQHIHRRYPDSVVIRLKQRIAELEAELAARGEEKSVSPA
ncbi:MAG: pyridoxamine 5'-phosphate oxidase family protein, partial [Myxococcota bacterium]